jgi:hypothetical protein
VAAGEHPEVAEADPVRAAQRDREVALEVLAADQRAAGAEALARPLRQRDDAVLVGELARRAREQVLGALGEPGAAARPGRDDAGGLRRVLGRLGDERELGVERLGDVVDEGAQERLADDSGGAGGDGAQQVTAFGGGCGVRGGGFEESGQGGFGTGGWEALRS